MRCGPASHLQGCRVVGDSIPCRPEIVDHIQRGWGRRDGLASICTRVCQQQAV
jgi:hypothetical protein